MKMQITFIKRMCWEVFSPSAERCSIFGFIRAAGRWSSGREESGLALDASIFGGVVNSEDEPNGQTGSQRNLAVWYYDLGEWLLRGSELREQEDLTGAP